MSGPSRNVVVGGGTGALGQAVVQSFLEAGDRVVVPWIKEAEQKQLAAAHPGAREDARLVLLEADVAEASGARATAQRAGSVDVLVNGVGGFAGGPPLVETDLESWDRMYRMNLRTAVALCRAVLPGMLARGRGVVVNVSSQAARARPPGLAAYSASKAGVLVLTETLQKEVEATSIRVNAIAPATIDTPANRRAMPDADFSSWTPPEVVAGVVRWLASDAAASVRGACIPV
jgi:NAD(P)-dependent dehydrogenase (short-subunit alcohol dehydrogenase family)